MANSVELLHELFVQWGQHRTPHARPETETLSEHRRAVLLLNDVERVISQLESDNKRTAPFRKRFPSWAKYVFVYPNDWQHGVRLDSASLDVLETLINQAEPYQAEMDETRFEELLQYLEAVDEAISTDPSIPPTIRSATQATVAHIREVIEHFDKWGSTQLETALLELISRLIGIGQTSKKTDGTWQKLRSDFFIPYLVNQVPELSNAFGNLLPLTGLAG